jgi:hypothetical protein
MRQHGEDRKFVIALLTEDAVTLDCRHNRKNSSDEMYRKLPSVRGPAEAWLLKPSVALSGLIMKPSAALDNLRRKAPPRDLKAAWKKFPDR